MVINKVWDAGNAELLCTKAIGGIHSLTSITLLLVLLGFWLLDDRLERAELMPHLHAAPPCLYLDSGRKLPQCLTR